MIKATQGFRFRYLVQTPTSKMVVRGDDYKLVIESIEVEGDTYYLTERADITAQWEAGIYKYQILNEDGIEDEGEFEILKNFYLTDECISVKSQNEKLLEAIEAQLAGKATSAQSSMSVGDKSISYCTIDELFKLRDYFKKKVSEEKGSSIIEGNQMKIKYKWSVR